MKIIFIFNNFTQNMKSFERALLLIFFLISSKNYNETMIKNMNLFIFFISDSSSFFWLILLIHFSIHTCNCFLDKITKHSIFWNCFYFHKTDSCNNFIFHFILKLKKSNFLLILIFKLILQVKSYQYFILSFLIILIVNFIIIFI